MQNTAPTVILNVEDNEATRYTRSRILRRAGFVVCEATNGVDALAMAATERPALVLLDVKLPDIDGFEVCRRLKNQPDTATTIVLQVSANLVERGDKIRGLEGGADGYLTEPMTSDELVATVRSYVRLYQAEDKLLRANRELQRQTDSLRRSNDELQQFAYAISHDLQEPLRAISMYSQLLIAQYAREADPEVREFTQYITDGVERMQALIVDLLEYSRVDTQAKAVTQTDCTYVVNQVLQDLQFSIEESGAQVTVDPLPTVWGDSRRLAQVFLNLLGNALKFRGSHPPRIHVSATQSEEGWRFCVQDNGIGIDPQFAERVFAIFQRLHLRHEYPGTGIGLAICKKIVEQHGGRIWVESRLGEGASFFFTLPLEQDHDA